MKKYTSFGQYQTGCRVALLSVLLICQGARADPVPVTSSNFSQMLHNPSGNYQLVEDIVWPQAWEPWNFPPFSGVFNGDNHVVHNATLFVEPGQGTGQGGFFQETVGAVVKNLAFYRLQVSGYNLSGLLSGNARDSVFTNIRCIDCTVTGQPGEDAALLFGSSVNNRVSGVEIDGSAIALPGLPGMDGMAGANGQMGAAMGDPTVVLCMDGTDGMKGHPGANGTDGSHGKDGKPGGNAALLAVKSGNSRYYHIVTHPGKIMAGAGGAGGKGGNGGKGGGGGTGQNGGDVHLPYQACEGETFDSGNGGTGGTGGKGGKGGNGGNGNKGGDIGIPFLEGTGNTLEEVFAHSHFMPGGIGPSGAEGLEGGAGNKGAGGNKGQCVGSSCIPGSNGNPGQPGNVGDPGTPGMPGQPGTLVYPAAANIIPAFFINTDNNPALTNLTLPGFKAMDNRHLPDTYTGLDKTHWRVVEGLSPYPVELDDLYLASTGLDDAAPRFAYSGCWFASGRLKGMAHVIRLQEGQVHSLSGIPRRLGSSYWARFRPEGDRLPLNSPCGTEQFGQLNPGGALVDGFIPMGHRRALILWRIPDTGCTRLALVHFPDQQPVQFERLRACIDGIVLDHAFLGDDLALMTETGVWLVNFAETVPETAKLTVTGHATFQQLWSNHHNRLYVVETYTTGPDPRTMVHSLIMDHGQLAGYNYQQAGLDPGEQILAGTAGAGKVYLLSRKADGYYRIWVQPEPEYPQPEMPEVIDVNALLSAAAPQLNQQAAAIRGVGITVLGDTLHLLVCHEQTLWWGLLGPDQQLIQSNKTELTLPGAVTITGSEFVVEEDKITAFCTGVYDYGQPYWGSLERNLTRTSSQAGTYTTPALIITSLLLSLLNVSWVE